MCQRGHLVLDCVGGRAVQGNFSREGELAETLLRVRQLHPLRQEWQKNVGLDAAPAPFPVLCSVNTTLSVKEDDLACKPIS